MKQKLLLFLSMFLLLGGGSIWGTKQYASWETPASNGKWDAETSTYSWTAAWSNLATIFQTSGNLQQYTSLHFTTSDYTDTYRVCFMNGSSILGQPIVFYSAGQKDLVFSERNEIKNIDLSQVTHIAFGGNSASGSIIVKDIYLEKPTEVTFDSKGIYNIPLTDISVASGNITYDATTGTVTVPANGSGVLKADLGNADFTNVTMISNSFSDFSYLSNTFIFSGNNGIGGWYSSKDNLTLSNERKIEGITHINYTIQSEAGGTFTINSIQLKADMISCAKGGMTSLKSLPYKKLADDSDITPTWDLTATDGTIYGTYSDAVGSGVNAVGQYCDLTDFEELRIYKPTNEGLRLFMIDGNNEKATQVKTNEKATWDDAESCIVVKIADLPTYNGKVLLQGIKTLPSWLGGSYTTQITEIAAYKTPEAGQAQYTLSGSGIMSEAGKKALADVNTTHIDATGLTNTKPITLTPANPNCIFVAAEGKLANENNVAIDNTVANLVLTDGYSFKAPEGLTAKEAQYERTMTTLFGTIILPFDAKSNETVQFYSVINKTANSIELEEVDELAAGTPAIMQQKGGKASINATNVTVSNEIKEAADVVTMHGSYTMDTKVTDANAYYIKGDKFWKRSDVADDPHFFCDAFRAYFTVEGNAAVQAKALAINVSGNPTGVNAVEELTGNGIEAVYNAAGVKQNGMQKGVNIVRLANGKNITVIVK